MGATSSEPVDMNSTAARFVQQKIGDNCVVVFSKTTCGFCHSAKRLFKDLGVNFEVVELNQVEDGSRMQDILGELTGESTVPRVFVGGKCIGGCSEAKSLHQRGKLVPLLKECGSL